MPTLLESKESGSEAGEDSLENPHVHNWFGNITSSPRVVVEPRNVQDIIAVMQDPVRYPSPVRAVGSNHSTSMNISGSFSSSMRPGTPSRPVAKPKLSPWDLWTEPVE